MGQGRPARTNAKVASICWLLVMGMVNEGLLQKAPDAEMWLAAAGNQGRK